VEFFPSHFTLGEISVPLGWPHSWYGQSGEEKNPFCWESNITYLTLGEGNE